MNGGRKKIDYDRKPVSGKMTNMDWRKDSSMRIEEDQKITHWTNTIKITLQNTIGIDEWNVVV